MNIYKYHNKPKELYGYKDRLKIPELAYSYIKKKNKLIPELEPVIIKDPKYAYEYAIEFIKDRWPEAEPSIAKVPEYAYEYAIELIDGRWLEAEPYIMKDPEIAFQYASQVINDRWPEAEPYIAKGEYWAELYNDEFGTTI